MSQPKKSLFLKIVVAVAVTFFVPLSFYLVAKLLKKDHIQMPKYYVADGVDSNTGDTIFHKLSDLTLTNQLGQQVSLNKDLEGQVLVINFFFTHCPSVCPKLTRNMKLLERAFRKDPKREEQIQNKVQLISITVNPERDSFPQLRAYADKFNVNHDHWWFLTGDKKRIYNFARHELGLSVGEGDGGADDFIHSEKIIIVDRNRYIRGYFDGLDSAAIYKCAYDISLLTMEKDKKKKK